MKNSFLCVGSFLLAASFFTSCTEDKDCLLYTSDAADD